MRYLKCRPCAILQAIPSFLTWIPGSNEAPHNHQGVYFTLDTLQTSTETTFFHQNHKIFPFFPMIFNYSHPFSSSQIELITIIYCNLGTSQAPSVFQSCESASGARSNTLASEHALWITFYLGAGSLVLLVDGW